MSSCGTEADALPLTSELGAGPPFDPVQKQIYIIFSEIYSRSFHAMTHRTGV